MPTDLPEFFSGTKPLEPDRKALRKAARKAMGQTFWAIAKSLILHYALSLAGVAVIAAAGFSTVPRAALSATALGLLARWFLPNKARAQADQQLKRAQGLEVVELTPDQLQEFMAGLHQYPEDENTNGPTPYM